MNELEAEVKRVAHLAQLLFQRGCYREAILLRFCLCGKKISTVTRMSLGDLVEYDRESERLEVSPGTIAVGEVTDPFFAEKLSSWVLAYLRDNKWLLARDPASSAFASRKGKGPITPRTAERSLVRAWQMVRAPAPESAPSFRAAKVIGLRWRVESRKAGSACVEVSGDDALSDEQLGDELMLANHKLEWFGKRAFPRDVHAREDAKQEAAATFLQCWRNGTVVVKDQVSERFVLQAMRLHLLRERSSKVRLQAGVVEDWSFIAEGDSRTVSRGVFPRQLKAQNSRIRIPPPQEFERLFRGLDVTAKSVIRHRFGFEDGRFHSRRETSLMLGVSEAVVLRIEKEALTVLRESLVASSLAEPV